DPGVGGARREVIVRARGQWYVAPDNGVLAYVAAPADPGDRSPGARRGHGSECFAIEGARFRAEHVSRTFHGRDVFARAAAAIAAGDDPASAGPQVELAGRLPWGPRAPGTGRIVHIDRFGNL